MNANGGGTERYVDPAVVRSALSLLDDLPFAALWIRGDHEVLWANAAARKQHRAVFGACFSVCYGYSSPCSMNGTSCPKELAEKSGRPVSVVHATSTGGSVGHAAEELFRIFALPLSAGGVLELHIPLSGDATKDPITGCLSRRTFEQLAGSLFASAKVSGGNCALLNVDVAELDLVARSQGSKARDASLRRIAVLVEGQLGARSVIGQWFSNQFVSVGIIERPIELEHLIDSLKSSLGGESLGMHRAAALVHVGLWQGPPDRPLLDVLHETEQSMRRLLESRKAVR